MQKKIFAAATAIGLTLSFGASAHAFNIGDFFKGVGNVLTGGLLGLAEGAAKVAKTGKVTPGDILNFATGGAAGAVRDAVKTTGAVKGAVKGLVHSAVDGIRNSVKDLVSRIGGAIPGLPKNLTGGGAGGPLGMIGNFASTFTSSLPKIFAGGIKKTGMVPGKGLFSTGLGFVKRALEQAKQAAMKFAKSKGFPVPNLGGLTSFFQSNITKVFGLGSKVAQGTVKRVTGQFRALIKPGTVTKAIGGYTKHVSTYFRGKKR